MGEDRPSLWKSLKRALGGAAPPEPAAGAREAPPPQILPNVNDTPPFLAEAEPTVECVPSPPIRKPDFLPEQSSKPAEVPISAPKEGETSAPQAARLARGLASFSRRNPEREKKFAHLLHDDPADEKKGSPPPGREG